MKALSIRQPWANLILFAGKDIENRSWHTRFRGPVLIHAAKGMTQDEWSSALEFGREAMAKTLRKYSGPSRTFKTIERGGIVGVAEIVDCVSESNSPWFIGDYGFVLANVRPVEFFPCKGSLGFFDVPFQP